MPIVRAYSWQNGIELSFEVGEQGESCPLLWIILTSATATAKFQLDETISIPRGLINFPTLELRRLSDILASAEESTKRKLIEELETLRQALQQLRGRRDEFCGVQGIAGVGFAEVTLQISLPDAQPPARAVVFQARATADIELKLDYLGITEEVRAQLGLEVTLRDGVIRGCILANALKYPVCSWRVPEIDLSSLQFQLGPIEIPTFEPLDLSIPHDLLRPGSIPSGTAEVGPFTIAWNSAPPKLECTVATGNMTLQISRPDTVASVVWTRTGDRIAELKKLSIILAGPNPPHLTVTGEIKIDPPRLEFSLAPDGELPSDCTGPFGVRVQGLRAIVDLTDLANIKYAIKADRISIYPRSEPAAVVSITVTVEFTAGKFELTELKVIEPTPLPFIPLAKQAVEALLRIGGSARIAAAHAALVQRMSRLLRALVQHAIDAGGTVGKAITGLTEGAVRLIERFFDFLGDLAQPSDADFFVEVRLDPRTYAICQVVLALKELPAIKPISLLGLQLELTLRQSAPFDSAQILIDLRGTGFVGLIIAAEPDTGARLSTDLWLDREGDASEGLRNPQTPTTTATPDPLIKIRLAARKTLPISLLAVTGGRVRFFQKLRGGYLPDVGTGDFNVVHTEFPQLEPLKYPDDFSLVTDPIDVDRILPFLNSRGDSNDPNTPFSQYLRVKSVNSAVESEGPTLSLTLKVDLVFASAKSPPTFDLTIKLDLTTLRARVQGGQVVIRERKRGFDAMGLRWEISPKSSDVDDNTPFDQLVLDFSSRDPRILLSPKAQIDLYYSKMSSSGPGLLFTVRDFAITRDGIDLAATVSRDEPVTLAGVATAFRFESGDLIIKRGRFQGATIVGSGSLPPALVGEAKAKVAIQFGADANQNLVVLSAKAELDKTGDPLIAHSTRFHITITELGFQFVNDGGYHFYFTLTGSAEFRPAAGELADGLLKNLPSIRIVLKQAPLAAEPEVLLRHIEFQIPIDPPKETRLFNLFRFQVRGIGFHPASDRFEGNPPAMAISGQINFVNVGDVVSSKFDFHKLWIAPPKPGDDLPRVRCDGLTIGVAFGPMARIEGTAIAVDGSLPTLYSSPALKRIVAHGFLASGTLKIAGWASMTAAVGFLELERDDGRKFAFFVYGQINEQAVQIPTPIGTIYLREAGFGMGHRFTLAGLAEADRVSTPKRLVQVLDEVSKYQGNLHEFQAWQPEERGDRLTLAMRAMFSITSASADNKYDARAESDIPNPLLFDVIAAIRSDLTFLMMSRVWLAVNYQDWNKDRGAQWQLQPTAAGYLYISVPRREFLSRFRAGGGGHVGDHPPLPKFLKDALATFRWSSTLYIRPGLFHMELGWPYELQMALPSSKFFSLTMNGGLIFRIEMGAMLYGLAFRAKGYVHLEGKLDLGFLGAAIVAHADFSLEAKFIAYISVVRPKDTLFYGLLKLDVTVTFSVRVWLDVGFFTLKIGFSIQLSVSVAVEMAISLGTGIGGHIHAAVGVRAFGRSLTIGISMNFGSGALAQARAQVARFMSLGLGVATPDPEKGPPLAVVEPPRRETTEKSDRYVRDQARMLDACRAAPLPEPFSEIPGDPIGQTDYWAMLFPTTYRGAPGYLLQLIPRDHTECPAIELDSRDRATFFAAPICPDYEKGLPASETDKPYALSGLSSGALLWLSPDGCAIDWQDQRSLQVEWTKTVADASESESDKEAIRDNLPLSYLLWECFLDSAGNQVRSEPWPRHYKSAARRLDSDPTGAAQELGDAGRERRSLRGRDAREAEVHERRSSVITSVAESAAAIAGRPTNDGWARAENVGLDARWLGLTFFITKEGVKTLFSDPSQQSRARVANFRISTRPPIVGAAPPPTTELGRIHLFNPPDRMFRAAQPRLTDITHKITSAGIILNWDLEPAWGRSAGAYDDPEFSLKHYEVQRRITHRDESIPTFSTTVKGCAPSRAVRNTQGTVQEWENLRPEYQYVDNLSDLKTDLRTKLLAGNTWGDDVTIDYSIVPIDIAGTRADPTPVEVVISPKPRSIPEIKVARLIIEYAKLNEHGMPVQPKLLLGVDVGADNQYDYRLLIRKDRIIPSGVYGADALTDAKDRRTHAIVGRYPDDPEPWPVTLQLPQDRPAAKIPASDKDSPASFTYDAPLPLVDAGAGGTIAPSYEVNGLPRFMQELGVASFPMEYAVRVAIQTFRKGQPLVEPGLVSDIEGAWRTLELVIRIPPELGELQAPKFRPEVPGERKPKNDLLKQGVEAPVEFFEPPMHLEFKALGFQDLAARCGRVDVCYPAPNATLTDLVKDAGLTDSSSPASRPAEEPTKSIRILRDNDRRVGTRLRWNAHPLSLQLVNAKVAPRADDLQPLVGGFDLFDVNPDALPVGIQWGDYGKHARYLGRVQLIPAAMANTEPAELGDPAKIEAYYPSEALRLTLASADTSPGANSASTNGGSSDSRPLRAPWLSPAESILVWPRLVLRRFLLPVPDEEIIAELFSQGTPVLITAQFVPDRETLPRVEFNGVSLDDFRWICDNRNSAKPLDPSQLRAWLRSLRWTYPDQVVRPTPPSGFWDSVKRSLDLMAVIGQVDGRFAKNPMDFANVKLRITAKIAKTTETPSIEVPLRLAPPHHGFLADVLDTLRYENRSPGPGTESSAGDVYLRYEPVLETPPEATTKVPKDWMQQLPVERDPYGWSSLQMLGLAVRLRLYDTEHGEFVDSQYLLRMVNVAITEVAKAYALLEQDDWTRYYGQPFVDLVVRPAGLYEISSFDGGTPEPTKGHARDIVTNEALTLIQVALRPSADRLTHRSDGANKMVRYMYVRRPLPIAPDVRTLKLELKNELKSESVVVEVLPCSHMLGKQDIQTMVKGVTLAARLNLTQNSIAKIPLDGTSEIVAILRVTRFKMKRDDPAEWPTFDPTADFEIVPYDELQLPNGPFSVAVGDSGTIPLPNPFGRFPELSARLLALATWGAPEDNGVSPKLNEIYAFSALEEQAGRLDRLLKRALGNASPPPADAGVPANAREEFMAAYIAWGRRFMNHGPARRITQAEVSFSLATITRPTPWRLAPDEDGTLEVFLLEKSRFGFVRRYAVRPFGRYEPFARACEEEEIDVTPRLTEESLSFTDEPPLVDVVMPRTEPLAKPVILYSGRPDRFTDASPENGKKFAVELSRYVEVIVARHPEEILSDTNRVVDAGLGYQQNLVGFWREFAAKGWVDYLRQHPNCQKDPCVINVNAEFGSKELAKPPSPPEGETRLRRMTRATPPDEIIGGDDASYAALANRFPDIWRGATVYRLHELPYFFRIHSLAYATAGAVVSPSAEAAIEEGYYELSHPWQRRPDVDPTTPPPTWTLQRVNDKLVMRIEIPLLRFVDCMSPQSRAVWLRGNDIPTLFYVPDPAATYRIGIEATLGDSAANQAPVAMSRAGEFDLMPPSASKSEGQLGSTTPDPASGYSFVRLGSRFKLHGDDVSRPEPLDSLRWWRLTVDVEPTPPGFDPAPNPSLAEMTEGEALLFEKIAVPTSPPERLAAWLTVAPRKKLELLLTFPGSPNRVMEFLHDMTRVLPAYARVDAPVASLLQKLEELKRNPPRDQQVTVAEDSFPIGAPPPLERDGADVISAPLTTADDLNRAGTRFDVRALVYQALDGSALRLHELNGGTRAENPLNASEKKLAEDYAIRLRRSMRDVYVAIRLRDDRGDVPDSTGLGKIRPVLRVVDERLRCIFLKLAEAVNALPPDERKRLSLLRVMAEYELIIEDLQTIDPVVLFHLLEDLEDSGDAIAVLGPIEDGAPTTKYRFRMPYGTEQAQAVVDYLKTCDCELKAPQCASPASSPATTLPTSSQPPTSQPDKPEPGAVFALILEPLDDVQMRRLSELCQRIDPGLKDALLEFVDRIAHEQLFGPSRRLLLEVFRGFANPIAEPVLRAKGQS